jgi:hypothetical protein
VMQENSVLLDRAELLKWSGWKGASRRHIEAHDGDIEFLPAIATYSTKVREFYGWFWEQVTGDEKSASTSPSTTARRTNTGSGARSKAPSATSVRTVHAYTSTVWLLPAWSAPHSGRAGGGSSHPTKAASG